MVVYVVVVKPLGTNVRVVDVVVPVSADALDVAYVVVPSSVVTPVGAADVVYVIMPLSVVTLGVGVGAVSVVDVFPAKLVSESVHQSPKYLKPKSCTGPKV